VRVAVIGGLERHEAELERRAQQLGTQSSFIAADRLPRRALVGRTCSLSSFSQPDGVRRAHLVGGRGGGVT